MAWPMKKHYFLTIYKHRINLDDHMICNKCGAEGDKYRGQSYCKLCSKKQQDAWARANRTRKADINRAWRKRHSERRRIMQACTSALWRAIRNNEITRGQVCTFCDSNQVAIEAAHSDYSKPLDVIWLCRKCHRQWDAIRPKT